MGSDQVKKGKNVSVESRMGECYQWKPHGQCSRTDSCSFSQGSNRGQQAQSYSPPPKTQTQFDGRRPSSGAGPREKVLLEGKVGKRAKVTSKEIAQTRPVIISIFPCVKLTSQYRYSNSATNVNPDMLRLVGSPVRSRRKVVGRINCFTEGVYTIGLRVFGYRATEEVYSTEELKIGTKLHRQVLQGRMAHEKNSGKKESIARSHSKV